MASRASFVEHAWHLSAGVDLEGVFFSKISQGVLLSDGDVGFYESMYAVSANAGETPAVP
jgi:hypothetical protein